METCGWAFGSVTPPWVAQRVWAMPTMPCEVLGLAHGAFHLGHAPDAAHAPDRPVQHRDARRIVAAVLEALQALGEDGHDVTAGDGADDSAHGVAIPARGGRGGAHFLTTAGGARRDAKNKALPGLGPGRVKQGGMLLASRRPAGRGRGGNPRPEAMLRPTPAPALRHMSQPQCEYPTVPEAERLGRARRARRPRRGQRETGPRPTARQARTQAEERPGAGRSDAQTRGRTSASSASRAEARKAARPAEHEHHGDGREAASAGRIAASAVRSVCACTTTPGESRPGGSHPARFTGTAIRSVIAAASRPISTMRSRKRRSSSAPGPTASSTSLEGHVAEGQPERVVDEAVAAAPATARGTGVPRSVGKPPSSVGISSEKRRVTPSTSRAERGRCPRR